MSARHGKKAHGRGRGDVDQAPLDDAAAEGKPLPPPPPLRQLAAKSVGASSPIPTLVDPPRATEVDGPQALESEKPTIVGIPVPAPDASAEARQSLQPPAANVTSPIVRMDDSTTSDPEIPLTLGAMNRGLLLLAQRKREAVLGSVAVLGLLTGFYFVLSLAPPRSHPIVAAATVAAQPTLPASTPVSEPAVGGSSPTATVVEVPPVATPPEDLPPPTATAPRGEPVAAPSSLTISPSPPTPAAGAPPTPAKPPVSPPPPASRSGPCSPPYRLDFFGKKVTKPGCS
jgi:hypothetical protein